MAMVGKKILVIDPRGVGADLSDESDSDSDPRSQIPIWLKIQYSGHDYRCPLLAIADFPESPPMYLVLNGIVCLW